MTRSILGRTAFALAITLTLGFGARDVLASPRSATNALPFCRDDAHCQSICATLHPNVEVEGVCSGNTCTCFPY